MQNLFIKFAVFHGKIIFQLLSCLYLYDSGIQVPVCIRRQSRYTSVRRLALTYRAAGILASEATGVCAKPVYRRVTPQGSLHKVGIPASIVLRVNILFSCETKITIE